MGAFDILLHIAGAIVLAIALGFLARNAKFHADSTGKRSVLKYGTPIRIFAWLLLCGLTAGLYMGSRRSIQGPGSWLGVFAFFAGVMLVLFLEIYVVRIEFDDYAIYTRSPWRPERSIPWSEITSYSFSGISQWYVFRTRSMGAVRLSVYLSGRGSFMAEARRRLIID